MTQKMTLSATFYPLSEKVVSESSESSHGISASDSTSSLSFVQFFFAEKNARKTTGSKEEPSQLDRELAEAAKTKV